MAESRPPDAGDDAGNRRRWLGPLQILVVLALVALAVLYARAPDGDAGGPPGAAIDGPGRPGTEAPPPLVSVFRPVASETVLKVAATGSVQVRNHVALMPQVGGRVVSVSPALRAGGSFAADEELLVIDRRDFDLALRQARADVDSARSTLLLQRAESDAARANYALLHGDDEVPPLVARVPQIAQATAQLKAAQARVDIASLDLQRTSFSLPFDGRIAESSAEVGQVLARGQSFGRAFAFDAVQVAAPVAAEDLRRLLPAAGRKATVRDSHGAAFAAVVERTSAELDDRTRFAMLYLRFDEALAPTERPPPGTFVDVEVQGPALADTFLLPEAAEQIAGSVWVVADGKLRQVQPRSIARSEDGWVVASFDAADGVALGAVPGARPGLEVAAAAAP